jgi:hypothetical protein
MDVAMGQVSAFSLISIKAASAAGARPRLSGHR